jgi:hypothetical protein
MQMIKKIMVTHDHDINVRELLSATFISSVSLICLLYLVM